MNDLSIWTLFTTRRRPELATLPVDWESNAENYDEQNNIAKGHAPQPLHMKLYRGMRVHLCRNMNKKADFVNGMEATVMDYDPSRKYTHVLTQTQRHLAVYPISEYVPECGSVTAYPMRLGYASTHQLQGAELRHITVWLDVAFMKAARYVALSRVQRDSNYLIRGRVSQRHFIPAM